MSSAPTDRTPEGESGPIYPIAAESQFEHGRDSDRDAAFARLSAVLENCADAVRAAIAELSPDEIAAGLTALTVPDRGQVLRPLGLKLQPPRIGFALAADVLARLRRADEGTQR